MQEKELIQKLQELRQIKPRKDWVFSLKKEIIGSSFAGVSAEKEQPKFGSQILSVFNVISKAVSHRKLAYATVTAFVFLVAMVGGLFLINPSSNNNKFETELLTAALQSKQSLEIANQKLEKLAEIVQNHEIIDEKTIQDVKQTIVEASKTITKEIVENPKALKEIVGSVKQIDSTKKNLETLGIIVDPDYQLNNVLQPLVLNEIESLEKASLDESQQITLKEIKGLYDEGQYADALEKILLITSSK